METITPPEMNKILDFFSSDSTDFRAFCLEFAKSNPRDFLDQLSHDSKVVALIRKGNIIVAIKEYRAQTNCDFVTAKNHCFKLRKEMGA